MATRKILTIADVAELLKVHPITVYRMIKQGKLPVFRIGRVLRFDADQLEEWIRAKQYKVEPGNGRRKPKTASSAEYVAYRRGATFAPEKLLETLAISRPALVRPFVDANRTGHQRIICARCREADKPIAALLLFASVEGAKSHWKKQAMPFCRACFAQLRKFSRPDTGGRIALDAASKENRAEGISSGKGGSRTTRRKPSERR
jgi:excisionase family DNA binding protein